jgi:hypothetical protein
VATEQTTETPTKAPDAAEPADADEGPQAIPERDYAKLLVADDEPDAATEQPEAEADTPAEAPAAETEEAKAPEATESEPAEAAAEVETPKPGTPDKVLQKMQQDLSAATRQLAALHEKIESGETLTAKEQKQVEKSSRTIDSIRAELEGEDFDVLKDGVGKAIAKTLDEHDRTDEELRKENKSLNERLERLERQTASQQAEAQWRATEQQYPGVKVRDVWAKAQQEAIEAAGVTPEELAADPKLQRVIANVASRTFHERASAAHKSVTAKNPPPPTPPAEQKPKATRTAPPVTPGGARVAQSSGVAPPADMDEHAKYRLRARSLVTD